MAEARETLALAPIGDDPEVGRWLAAMEDARDRTLGELERVSDEMLDRRPIALLGTIGELLYHVGLIEADWLLSDILDLPADRWPSWVEAEFPIDVRDERGRLSEVPAQPLVRHLERLARVRTFLLVALRPMTGADFRRLRRRDGYDVAPGWAIHHLLQHEAEHRAHIALIRDALA
jgi:DinB superfamily